MKKYILLLFFILGLFANGYTQKSNDPESIKSRYIQLSGELFEQVQLSGIFKDSKTFVDAVPLKEPVYIRALYDSIKTLPDFDLGQFIHTWFKIPQETSDTLMLPKNQPMEEHINRLWNYLIRKPDPENQYSTLLPLNHPYIVPGGRFREIYYWDSFFTILGLLADSKPDIAENMVQNFAGLINKYKMIPNGNRVYYLTRSQPPFFSLMIDIICRHKKDFNWGLQFIPQLEAEYSFWMNGLNQLSDTKQQRAAENVVRLNSKNILNRYYDYDDIPREESFKEDYSLSLKVTDSLRPQFLRNLRAGAESGWDFSSRWFKDGKSLITIQTTDILPVDLNCLFWFLEDRLSYLYKLKGDNEKSKIFEQKAALRKDLINNIFWNKEEGFYFDYNWKTGTQTKVFSLAGCFPLYFNIAGEEQAKRAAENIRAKFLKPGGLVATLYNTGQQWDAPNGWPPLQWIAIKGLREYGLNSLADTIKQRWLTLNQNVYKRTGRMLEKYNVENLSLFAGGGEYPLQDGFGWTNGVAAALMKNFDKVYLMKETQNR